MKVLTRDQIIAASDRRIISVEVPQWHGRVFIRELSAKARGDLVSKWRTKKITEAEMPIMMVAISVTTEEGELLFTLGDAAALAEKSVGSIDTIATAAMKLNGMEPDKEGAEAEDFTPTAAADSSSG